MIMTAIMYLTHLLSSRLVFPLMQLPLSLSFLLFSLQVLACHSKHLSLSLLTFLVLALPPKMKMGSMSKESNALAIISTMHLATQYKLPCSSSTRMHLCLHCFKRNTPSHSRSKTAVPKMIVIIQVATTIAILARTNCKAARSKYLKSPTQDSKCSSWSFSNSNHHNRI